MGYILLSLVSPDHQRLVTKLRSQRMNWKHLEMKVNIWLERSCIKKRSSWNKHYCYKIAWNLQVPVLRQNGQSPGNFRGCPWFQQSGSKYQEMREHRDLFLVLHLLKGAVTAIKKGVTETGRLECLFICVWAEALMGWSHYRDWSPYCRSN